VMTTFVQDVTRSATIKNHVMTDRHGWRLDCIQIKWWGYEKAWSENGNI
jgi:hypothetical protein